MATVLTTPPTSAPPALLTWEAYMAEPQTEGRYDIVEGVRLFMPGATWRHQRVAKNISKAFTAYEEASGLGMTVFAPFDVLIQRVPKLQTRQPDALFLSYSRVQQSGGVPENGPLPFAPELVVEIVSSSETERILTDKIIDYITIGVSEVWVVRPDVRTVEVLTLTASGPQSSGTYRNTDTAQSVVFPTLSIPVADVLAD